MCDQAFHSFLSTSAAAAPETSTQRPSAGRAQLALIESRDPVFVFLQHLSPHGPGQGSSRTLPTPTGSNNVAVLRYLEVIRVTTRPSTPGALQTSTARFAISTGRCRLRRWLSSTPFRVLSYIARATLWVWRGGSCYVYCRSVDQIRKGTISSPSAGGSGLAGASLPAAG